LLEPLVTWLRESNRTRDDHLLQEAAGEALFHLIKNPHTYDPARSTLAGFLRMSAQCDLCNVLRRERRHQEHRELWSSVEEALDGGNTPGDADDPARIAELGEEQAALLARLETCSADWTEPERQVLRLMIQGERRTAVYAGVIRVTDKPLAQQRREVKRFKDRVGKRAKRRGA
jgi:DNA-directed RNA polymerase specialized sigma24 family protein